MNLSDMLNGSSPLRPKDSDPVEARVSSWSPLIPPRGSSPFMPADPTEISSEPIELFSSPSPYHSQDLQSTDAELTAWLQTPPGQRTAYPPGMELYRSQPPQRQVSPPIEPVEGLKRPRGQPRKAPSLKPAAKPTRQPSVDSEEDESAEIFDLAAHVLLPAPISAPVGRRGRGKSSTGTRASKPEYQAFGNVEVQMDVDFEGLLDVLAELVVCETRDRLVVSSFEWRVSAPANSPRLPLQSPANLRSFLKEIRKVKPPRKYYIIFMDPPMPAAKRAAPLAWNEDTTSVKRPKSLVYSLSSFSTID
ncbi:hypothetical protein C8J56DRAFT_890457 [Mycena floridula]|nr:hypothetical protein C8J56DRAFT_890457 [Mycena floridula]